MTTATRQIDGNGFGRTPQRAYSRARRGHVRQRHSSEDDSDSLSRKHTAEMLRKLRTLKHQVEMLKLRLDEEGATELRPRILRPRRKQQS
jgi:hypothetical protein